MRLRGFFVVLVTLLASLAVTGRISDAGTRAGGCTEPYAPVDLVAGYPGGESPPVIDGIDRASPLPDRQQLDSDADGAADEIGNDGLGLAVATIRRADGVVRFAASAKMLAVDGSTPGDLDGDGRDEISVTVVTALESVPYVLERDRYLVSGSIEPGTYDPAVVGTRLRVGTLQRLPGDATLLIQTEQNPALGRKYVTRLLSIAAILAAGAGGDARPTSVVMEVAGQTGAVVTTAAGATPRLVVAEQADSDDLADYDTGLSVRLVAVDGTTMAFAGPNFSHDGPLTGVIQYIEGEQGTFLISGRGSRSGNLAIVWRVDDPCGPLPPQPTTTTAAFRSGPSIDCTVPIRAATIAVDEAPVQQGPPIDATFAFLPFTSDEAIYLESHRITFLQNGLSTYVYQIGRIDLNGDGTRDFLVSTGFPGDGGALYAISGTVGAGPHEISAVGVRLPDDWSTTPIRYVGDQDDDGIDDLLVGSSDLYSGPSLLAPGPGGSASPSPERHIDGVVPTTPAGIADFGDGHAPTMLIVKQLDPTTAIISVGLDGPQLTTSGRDLYSPLGENPQVFGYLDDRGPVIAFEQPTGKGRPTGYWIWNLFGPCGGAAAAPPAIARPGRATFTG